MLLVSMPLNEPQRLSMTFYLVSVSVLSSVVSDLAGADALCLQAPLPGAHVHEHRPSHDDLLGPEVEPRSPPAAPGPLAQTALLGFRETRGAPPVWRNVPDGSKVSTSRRSQMEKLDSPVTRKLKLCGAALLSFFRSL